VVEGHHQTRPPLQIVEECEERLGKDVIQQLLEAVQTHLRGGE
jgi:hypothetical protein